MRRTWRSRRTSALRRMAEGFADGALATLPMSAFMQAAQRAGAMGQQPPERIAESGMRAAGGGGAPPALKKGAAVLLHFGFGATAGAAFSAWARRDARHHRRRPARARSEAREALIGMAFGSMIWAVSYMGWVPALGIMPPPQRDLPGRPWSMIVAHWIYGATLGLRTAARGA